jgi:hypothetical protein
VGGFQANKRGTNSMAEIPSVIPDKLISSLTSQLTFQRKWQRLSMAAYVSSTVAILCFSTVATLCAARQLTEAAAYLSAAVTVLVGLEKSLLFREKWKFHLVVATRLSVLLSEIDTGQIAGPKILEEYSSILKSYSEGLPIGIRDQS